ncbi:MAG: NUDIX domain-containing protein [Chloroflexi bacterium]|nr:NUDIX domain-containing protein [Chloroflexota bacterium]
MSDERMNFIAATLCAVVRGKRFLVIVRADGIKDAPGALVFPGAKVEVGDGLDDVLKTAVRREVLEETGISVSPDLEFIQSKTFELSDGTPVVDILFLGIYVEGEPRISVPEEVAAIHWMTEDEILAHEKAPQCLKNAINLIGAHREDSGHVR